MFSTIFYVIISLAFVHGKTSYVPIPPDQLPTFLTLSMNCASKTHIDSNTLQKLLAWNFENTEKVRQYIFCFARSSGFADSEGHIVKDKVIALTGNHKRNEELSEVLDQCNELVGSTKQETMYKTTMCFLEKSPIQFRV